MFVSIAAPTLQLLAAAMVVVVADLVAVVIRLGAGQDGNPMMDGRVNDMIVGAKAAAVVLTNGTTTVPPVFLQQLC